MKKVLSGVRVIECCQMVAGPYCSKLLADLGAEVIKIEPPQGDETRRRGPFLNDIPHPERSGLFLYLNTNKRGITLNLNSSNGKRIFIELAKGADILVEDMPPEAAKELGLDYDIFKKQNPRLIMTSITPFGQTGPYKDYKAYTLNIFHAGGEGYLIGGADYIDRPPLKIGGLVAEYDAGLSAAIATLAALYWSGISGLGQHIDLSKQEALMSLYRPEVARYGNDGVVLSRATSGFPLGGMLPCQDGYVVVMCWLESEWPRMLEAVGDTEWVHQEKFKTRSSAIINRDEIQAHLAEWTMSHTKDELYHNSQAKRAAVAPVFNAEDLAHSRQLRERGFFVEIEHPEMGKVECASVPYKISGVHCGAERPSPLLGEHNEEIYCGSLGYSKQDLVRMRQNGTI